MRARFTKAVAAAAALAFLSAGCASIQENPKSTIGGLGGAAAGGLIAAGAGGNTAAIVGGVLLGGLLGGAVGNALDQRDKELHMREAQLALESSRTGQVSTWSNPDSGNSGSFTPTRTYQEPSGRYCREYTEEIWVAGERQQAYGTACREPDGSWRVQQ
jgi:surface antigen